jgi:hypothetical protein
LTTCGMKTPNTSASRQGKVTGLKPSDEFLLPPFQCEPRSSGKGGKAGKAG